MNIRYFLASGLLLTLIITGTTSCGDDTSLEEYNSIKNATGNNSVETLPTQLPLPEEVDVSDLEGISFEKSEKTIPMNMHFSDVNGMSRIYITDNKEFAARSKQIREEIERLKTGNLIIDDFYRLKCGMTQTIVKNILGRETRIISDNPYQVEYDLEDGTTVALYFKDEQDVQVLDTTIFSESS
jgi:hypothetical protein